MAGKDWVVIGGSGFVGSAICRELLSRGASVTVADVTRPADVEADWHRLDLRSDNVAPPPGRLVLAFGHSLPRPVRPWTLVLDNALTTARLAPVLADRQVVLLSTIEVYGAAPAPLREDSACELPLGATELAAWVNRSLLDPEAPVSPALSIERCRALADADPSGRWVYAISKLAQEEIVRRVVAPEDLLVLRLANVSGAAQYRLLGRLAEAMLQGRPVPVTRTTRSFVAVEDVGRIVASSDGLAGTFNVSAGSRSLPEFAGLVATALDVSPSIALREPPVDDSCGDVDGSALGAVLGGYADLDQSIVAAARAFADGSEPLFRPPLPVVVPPRPDQPHLVAARTAEALWNGTLRHGRYSHELAERLAEHLDIAPDRTLLLTNSGTNALRLAIAAVAGRPAPGAVALCPAFTFHATAEVLKQLGWTVRLVDVDPWTWTMDAQLLAEELADPAVGVVVVVDALGNPADYERLAALCRAAGIPLVADSAPALGSRHLGRPIANQAAAHSYSMSFAKTLSGGGTGGAVVMPQDAHPDELNWARSSPMSEPGAIAALDQLLVLDQLVERRQRIAHIYEHELGGQPGFVTQRVRPGDVHSWVHWVVRVPPTVGRDRLAAELARAGVSTKGYYEQMSAPASGPLPVTSTLHAQALALPMSSELSVDDGERVVAALGRSLRRIAHEAGAELAATLA